MPQLSLHQRHSKTLRSTGYAPCHMCEITVYKHYHVTRTKPRVRVTTHSCALESRDGAALQTLEQTSSAWKVWAESTTLIRHIGYTADFALYGPEDFLDSGAGTEWMVSLESTEREVPWRARDQCLIRLQA